LWCNNHDPRLVTARWYRKTASNNGVRRYDMEVCVDMPLCEQRVDSVRMESATLHNQFKFSARFIKGRNSADNPGWVIRCGVIMFFKTNNCPIVPWSASAVVRVIAKCYHAHTGCVRIQAPMLSTSLNCAITIGIESVSVVLQQENVKVWLRGTYLPVSS
jgi:hypothetical protein